MKFSPIALSLAAILSITTFRTDVSAQRPKPRPKLVTATVTVRADTAAKVVALPPAQQRRQEAFMQVWTTLNYYYFDKTFSGLDWDKIRLEYQPRVTAAKTDAELHRIIEEMINRLDKSHFGLIPPEYFEDIKAAKVAARSREKLLTSGKQEGLKTEEDPIDDEPFLDDEEARYGIGVELRLIDNQFVISSVDEMSSASLVGLKPGFVIDKINGVAMTDLIRQITASFPNVRHIRHYMPTQVVAWFLNGERDTSVYLTCLDGNNEQKEYKVPRITLPGQSVSFGDRFPAQFLQYRSLSLDDDVGYIKFNVFSMQVIDKFCRSLSELSTKKAIILDLRGNLGGLLGTLVGLTGMVTDHTITLGTSLYRNHTDPLTIASKAKNFKGKIVLLVDDQTMSAAEFFSGGLKDNSRVLVVGEPTGGEALSAVSMKLATGAVLEYPIANFRTIKGRYLEANGVEPDYVVALDRRSLLNGVDPQMQKALALIKEGTGFPRSGPPDTIGGIGGAEAPPPPKAMPKPPPRATGPVTTIAQKLPVGRDPKADQLVADFGMAIGGTDMYNKIASYEASGKGTVTEMGLESVVGIHIYRQIPDKYSLIMMSDIIGEIRQVYNAKGAFLQTDYGLDTQMYKGRDTSKTHLLETFGNALDPGFLVWSAYDGIFEDEGRKMHVMEGRTAAGYTVGMTFDTKTKMLVRFTAPGMMYTFSDYRKVADLMLPFSIKVDGSMDIQLDQMTLNTKIEPANFEKKENCFDKPL